MKIKYSPDADVLTIEFRKGKPFDSRDLSEGVILHLTKNGIPLEIEILDASRVIQNKNLEVSFEKLLPASNGR